MITKKCRVCGKEYAACKNAARNPYNNTFRWQEVACSPECGSEYFRLIMESRNQQAAPKGKPYIADTDEWDDPEDDSPELLFEEQMPDEFGND